MDERCSFLLISCGLIGLGGCLALIVGNVVGSIVVPNHDWIADTVSDLAAGKYERIQDFALFGYAAALIACAVGAAHYHLGGKSWTGGVFCLTLLALTVTVIGARDEYGDADHDGIVIHVYLVYALGVLFAATPFLMAGGMGREAPHLKWIAVVCGLLWIVAAPIFFFLPTGIDGLYERGLGLISIAWTGTLSWMLLRAGYFRARRGVL